MIRVNQTFLLGFILILSGLAQAAGVEGLFFVVKGQVTVRSKGSDQLVPAKIGAKIHEGDQVVTGPDSRAKIVMADKNVFNVSPDTKLTIEKYRNDATEKNVSIKLDGGKLRSSLEQKYDGDQSQFNIKTPTSVAGVRGTDFVSSYNAQTHEASFQTFHGTVAVAAISPAGKISAPVMVKAGQTSSVKSNQLPAPAKAMPKQQLQQLNRETTGTADPNKSQSKNAGNSNGGGGANSAGNSTGGGSNRDPASANAGSGSSSGSSSSSSSSSSSNSSSNSSSSANSAAPGSSPAGPSESSSPAAASGAAPSMVSSQDVSPDAGKGLTATAPPVSAGAVAAIPAVLPTTPNNSGFLSNVSGVTGGTTHVHVTLTPY